MENINDISLLGSEFLLLKANMVLELDETDSISDKSLQDLKEFSDFFKLNGVFQQPEDSFGLVYSILENYVSKKHKLEKIPFETISQKTFNVLEKFSNMFFPINLNLYNNALKFNILDNDLSSRLQIANDILDNHEDLFCVMNKTDILSQALRVFLLSENLEVEKIKTLSNLLKIAIAEKAQNSINITLREARR